MRPGKKALDAIRGQVTGTLRPGEDIVAAGPAGCLGTAVLVRERREELGKHFSAGFLRDAEEIPGKFGIPRCAPEEMGEHAGAGLVYTDTFLSESGGRETALWHLGKRLNCTACIPVGKGGFLAALWKLAEASGTGLIVDYRKVPVRQETIEICEIFHLNPYRLQGQGGILFGMAGAESLVWELRKSGVSAAVIGQATDGAARLLYSGGQARYLERPAKEEREMDPILERTGEKLWVF
ncbi:MAG: hydrogenase maturation factor [Clostridiales bacterium]|nr:hydrogenase maturation factor [Clostridiales bacterium]